jgi:type I restriction enzyme, S subunit
VTATLRDICTAIVDCEHKTAPAGDGFALSVGTKAMRNGRLVLGSCKPVSSETYKLWTRRLEPVEGDLLLAREAPVGDVVRVPEGTRICLGQRTVLIRPDPDRVDPRFLHYWLLGPIAQTDMHSRASGATVPHLNVEDIRELDVSGVPDNRELQSQVGGILGAIDDLIENNRRRIALLEQMAQAIYREWFVHFRYPGHEDDELVDSPLGLVPVEWRVEPLSEVCERITDGAHHSPPSVATGYPMASVKDMNDWGFELESCRQISKEDFDRLVAQDCRPRAGDVLIAKDGSYLKHVFVVDRERDVVLLSSIAVLRPNGRLDPNLLARYLKDDGTKDRLRGLVSGVAVPRIVLKDFRKFGVLVPPPELQRAWIERALRLIECCRSLVATSVTLVAVRDLLLPKLVTGAIDVSKLDLDALLEEPAA